MLRKPELSAGLMGHLSRMQTLPTYLPCKTTAFQKGVPSRMRKFLGVLVKPFAFYFSLVEKVDLLFVGDVSFTGPIKYYVEHGHHTYNDSFIDVAQYIREADVSVANLESPFVDKDVYPFMYKGSKSVVMDASPIAASALR